MENTNELSNHISAVIEKLDAKDFGFYFFTLDTKGNPTAGVANIYEHVKILTELGYKAYIMHEKNEYVGVGGWLGEDYMKLPHVSIENQTLNVGPQDFIIIPEVFANVMDQTKKFPSKRIVLCQSYDYIFELMNFGLSWGVFGINDVITTSQKQATYIKSLFPSINASIVPVSIPTYFKPQEKPVKPVVSIMVRDQKDALKIIKSFYIQYPTYKWITFKELRGIPKEEFAVSLADSCLAVWIDPIAGFGTFPLEAMECNVPVIGKIPELVPEWMEESTTPEGVTNLKPNGVWSNNLLEIPHLIAQYLKVWLEDSVPENILAAMEQSKGQYTYEKQKLAIEQVYAEFVNKRKAEIISLQGN
jgi:hypothetical protein